jgi:tripartite-type tricarboxylate transporter receptor subunit TctC
MQSVVQVSRKSRFSVVVRGIALTLAMTLGAATPALAQYPDKPVTLIVPYPPGGGTDVIARIVQDKLRAQLGQPVIIENRGGAAGVIGTELAAKAQPDGYTVLFTLSSHTINPAIYKKLRFNTEKDFEAVSMVASLPQILVAHPSLPANNVKELIAMAKAKPDSLSYASVGNGSPGHIAGEMFKLKSGTMMTHVPYKGGGPAVSDVLGNQVPLLWVSIPAAAQFVKQGKLKALAVSTVKRSALFPDVPTVQESGIGDFEVDSWYAMFVPAHTPKAVVDRLQKALAEVVKQPDIKEKLLAQGAEAVGSAPAELDAVVKRELPKWAKLVNDAKITTE